MEWPGFFVGGAGVVGRCRRSRKVSVFCEIDDPNELVGKKLEPVAERPDGAEQVVAQARTEQGGKIGLGCHRVRA